MESQLQSAETPRATLARRPEVCQDGDRLVDLPAVAARLGISTRSVHRLIARGQFPLPVKVGRVSRWFVADIDSFMEGLKRSRPDNQVAQRGL